MSRTRTMLATTAVAVGSSTALIFSGVAAADPAVPSLPFPAAGLPGLPAIEQLSPVIQQAAADPSGAASLLMAAASAFTGNSAAPDGSRQVAESVTQFLQGPGASLLPAGVQPSMGVLDAPAAHVPAAGVEPGMAAHLPSGVDPANAVGPVPETAAAAAPVAAPPAVPEAAPVAPEAAPTAPEAQLTPAAPDAQAMPGPAPGFSPDSPPTQDFMYPSIGTNCLSDGGNSIATALSVAGPAAIPTPGPRPGQTAYVFTAVGTPGPAEVQKLPLNVTWVNLTTGRSGSATLQPRSDINPEGPTTLTAIVDTGSGSIMSTIFGQVTTKDHQCNFLPTIGSTVVP